MSKNQVPARDRTYRISPGAASLVALAAALVAPGVFAATLNLSTSDSTNSRTSFGGLTVGTTNWPADAGTGQVATGPAVAGNDYVVVAGQILRSTTASYSFLGDSLKLDGSTFYMRGATGTTQNFGTLLTVSAAGGSIRNIVENTGQTLAGTKLQLDGLVTFSVAGTGRVLTVAAPIEGAGGVTVAAGVGSVVFNNTMDLGAGSLTLSGAPLQLTGGIKRSAGTLAVAGGSLVLDQAGDDLVVASDYTNTGFGSGNTFNARAGVSGSGAIISKDMDNGGTNQGLSVNGGAVTAVDTALNLNVHTTSSITANGLAGNTSDVANGNYAIHNTGTVTKIRGAANSTAITDTRLSGGGVSGSSVETATSYAATGLAPTTATGNLGVTFTGTGAAGALTGQTVTVSDNFGESQQLAITGAAYDLAQANTQGTITIDAQHVSGVNLATVTVSNVAPTDATYTETLSGDLAVNADATGAGGTFSGIAAGSPGTNFDVGVNTSTAGHIAGTGVLTLKSDAVNGSGLGQTALTTQNFVIEGDVYNLAEANTHATVTVAAQHVSGNNTATVTVSNVAPVDATYTETLSGGLVVNANATGAGGTFAGLVAGGSGSDFSVGVNTSTAGQIAGTGVLTLNSDAVNGSGLGQTALTGQTFDITGNVFDYAEATVSNLVTVAAQHVNGTNLAAISIENTATPGDYTETLSATMSTSPAATGTGSVSGLFAGDGPDTTSLMVGVDTATAGAKSGTATVVLSSDEVLQSGLGNTPLGSADVSVVGDVYNFAVGGMSKTGGSGTFSGSSAAYSLDFGTLLLNTGTYTANLGALNTAPAVFSDLLSGLFAITAGSGFILTGFDPFSGLAGQGSHALTVALSSAALGSWSETIKFTWNGTNAAINNYVGPTSDIFLTLSGTVSETPEPGILWLMGSAGLLGWYSARRKAAKRA